MASDMPRRKSADPYRSARRSSPALSDISELTILSRSPSPVPQYDARFSGGSSSTAYVDQQVRGINGRFVSRKAKRAHSPEERYVSDCGVV
jgi:hypothetical protein